MNRFSPLLIALLLAGSAAAQAQTPVLLELFTSEGCSSCPPADRLLAQLAERQPYQNIEVIALSEHVDYWNHGGWRDPYSAPLFSQRQIQYAQQLGVPDVYTPQLVIDGQWEGVGSDASKTAANIQRAAKVAKSRLTVDFAGRNQKSILLRAKVEPMPVGERPWKLQVALVADHAESHVSGGENAGRMLPHIAVVKKLVSFEPAALSGELAVPSGDLPDKWHIVAFVQRADGKVAALTSVAMTAAPGKGGVAPTGF